METFYDIGANDLKELWDSDLEPSMDEVLDSETDVPEWACERTGKQVVLHDRLMTDAALGALPIKTEHSYSLSGASDDDESRSPANTRKRRSTITPPRARGSPQPQHAKIDDMEDECYPTMPLSRAWSGGADVKQEPASPASPPSPASPASSSCPPSPQPDHQELHHLDYVIDHTTGSIHVPQSALQQHGRALPQILLSASPRLTHLPHLAVKLEPGHGNIHAAFGLPPTPPSSLSSSDSEGAHSPARSGASPTHSGASPAHSGASPKHTGALSSGAPRRAHLYTAHTRQPIHTPLISSQPKGSTGTLVLTEEEKRTLLAEGYPVPTRLPLTKAEEKSLKKIRRKIKNKISAQESRRKKKEYVDQLERKVELLQAENSAFRKRLDTLTHTNAGLLNQLQLSAQRLLN